MTTSHERKSKTVFKIARRFNAHGPLRESSSFFLLATLITLYHSLICAVDIFSTGDILISLFVFFIINVISGGSWSTCMIGSNKSPPQDVAHLQFKSRIAFKLVWSPPQFNTVRHIQSYCIALKNEKCIMEVSRKLPILYKLYIRHLR